jgi:shikimate kinase
LELEIPRVKRPFESIVLIGTMGAGKSSVGRSLHRRTGMAFLETDEIVASNFGMRIPQIFSAHGEKKFRKAETEALQAISRTKRAVIVTGGGIVLLKENVGILKRLGLIVWLDGDEEALFARASQRSGRPLLQTKNPREAFSQIFHARKHLYAQIADIRLDTSQFTAEEVAVAILSKLRRLNRKPGSSAYAKATADKPIPAATT